MATRTFQLLELVRLKAEALGESGTRWIARLSDCVSQLESTWSVRIGEVVGGGSESLTLEVVCADGTPAILKLGIPGDGLAQEAEVYRIAKGRGYARLIAEDKSRNALLLERLGRNLADLDLPVREQMEVICATLREAWINPDSPNNLTTGAEKARWLAAFISRTWHNLDEPCARRTVDQALTFAEQRETAFSPDDSVLVHGDPHSHNTLTVPLSSSLPRFKFVDPDGLFAEPAYDLAIPMREWSRQLLQGDAMSLGQARCALLSELTGVDETAIWQWGFIERVSTGLLLVQLGMEPSGSEMLAVADSWSVSEIG